MQAPHIALLHTRSFPDEVFSEFVRFVTAENLQLQVEARDEDGRYAAVEWLIPTAVIAYIGRAYFESFLKEMGKDHYSLLKAGLKMLYAKLIRPEAPEVTLLSTKGKICADQPYSLTFSILAEAEAGTRFKLLLQRAASQLEYEKTISSFLEFLEAYHAGILDPKTLEMLKDTRIVGGTLLLAFNPATGQIEPIDPLAGKAKRDA